MVQVTAHSMPATTLPSQLGEGQFIEVFHAGIYYAFTRSYSHLDFVVSKPLGPFDKDDGENCVAFRFNNTEQGWPSVLTPEIADAIWVELRDQLRIIQKC